jgi:hypothetical protein
MHPKALAVMAQQWGLITTDQALEAGMTHDQISVLLRSRDWVSVRYAVYALRSSWESWDEFTGRPLARARAAHLTMWKPHVMSHDSAALELAMPILAATPELVHITRPDVRGSRHECGVKHHGARHLPEQVDIVGRIAVLEPSRTAVDIGREHGFVHGVVACDSALRMGVAREELRGVLRQMRNWPGITQARQAVEFADGRSESVGETLARILVEEMGLGPVVEPQFRLVIEGRLIRCDLRVGRHIFEFDGKAKYRPIELGGLADKPAEEVVWDEKTRQDRICGVGLGMSRIVWADFWGSQRERAKARFAREYALTEARFGTSLSGLERFLPSPQQPAA